MKKLVFLLLVSAFVASCSESVPTEPDGPTNFELSQDYCRFSNNGEDFVLEVICDRPWEATLDDNIEGISLSPQNALAGTTRVNISVSPNDLASTRTMEILFSSTGGASATFTVIQEPSALSLGAVELLFNHRGETKNMTVDTNLAEWSAVIEPSDARWCSLVREDNNVTVTVLPNSGDRRTASLRITAGNIVKKVPLVQSEYSEFYLSKEIVKFQEATKGNGIDLLLMGDGYVAADMERGKGKYETDMRQAADHFFSVYPLNLYRDYFNIWMIAAVSAQQGMSEPPISDIDTVFECEKAFNSTSLTCNPETVEEYVMLLADGIGKNYSDVREELTVIMPINYEVYAGTCIMSYDSGLSVAMCPTGSSFQKIVVHEAGGHGFGKLLDEYYRQYSTAGYSIKNTIHYDMIVEWKGRGMLANVDLNGTISRTTWAEFADYPDYDMVATFEGAYMYGYDIWRPEYNSCMNDNVLYFNAPSRHAMVRRIMRVSGEDPDYTIAEFATMEEGKIPVYPVETRSSRDIFVPLGPPIMR